MVLDSNIALGMYVHDIYHDTLHYLSHFIYIMMTNL